MLRIVLALAVTAAFLLAIGSSPREDTPPLRLSDGSLPNILLLTVDTLRADHLGYVRSGPVDLTPALDSITSSGTAFSAASTPAPTTRAATAALMTGSYRSRHGVRGNAWNLGRKMPVLAEVLAAAGYRTAAFFGNGILDPKYGFGRGFESYESFSEPPPNGGSSKDEVGVTRAVEWLEEGPREPWFLWLHLMDPHGPYNSAPTHVRAAPRGVDDRPERILKPASRNTGLGVLPRYQMLPGVRKASAYRLRYRAEIRHMDAQVRRLLRAMEALGLGPKTLIVLTADHGEGLGDRDYFFQHGWFANEASVAVPLAFRLPGRVRPGVTLDAAVSLVDVSPTLIGGLGLEVPPLMQGRDLSPALAVGRPLPVPPGPVFSGSTLLSANASVRIGRWRLVHTPGAPTSGGAGPEDPWEPYYEPEESYRLFDVVADPAETVDLADQRPEKVAELRALLNAWTEEQALAAGRPGEGSATANRHLFEMLKSLGYVD